MTISRRRFIQLGSLASASLLVPKFLRGFEFVPQPTVGGKILVVVQLTGGNDSLNMVIPYRNDLYYSSRPSLGIKRQDALSLTDDTGLHPALKNMKGLYDNGQLCIINGVGYPEPNRSHFRSMDIWQSGSDAEEIVTTGWIGRYLDGRDGTTMAIEVDDTLSLAMKGTERSGIAVHDVNAFHKAAANSYVKKIVTHADEHDEQLTGYLYKTLRETTSAADYLFETTKTYSSKASYPNTQLGKRLKTIGGLISAGVHTPVYYVSHGSFDTHVGQADRQQRLLAQLDDSLMAFITELKVNNKMDDVLIMTFSEFGRRVAQNSSNGTDHGAAGSMFVIGNHLKRPQLYNDLPSLSDLDDGDLRHTVDFKRVYATILDKWLAGDSKAVLGRRTGLLDFV